jgi:hypothetical protein
MDEKIVGALLVEKRQAEVFDVSQRGGIGFLLL